MDISRLIENAILIALIEEMDKADYIPVRVWDEGEYVPVSSFDEVCLAVFSVSTSTIHFAKKAFPTIWGCRGVLVIPGNGTDFISDWHCGDENFDEICERVLERSNNIKITC